MKHVHCKMARLATEFPAEGLAPQSSWGPVQESTPHWPNIMRFRDFQSQPAFQTSQTKQKQITSFPAPKPHLFQLPLTKKHRNKQKAKSKSTWQLIRFLPLRGKQLHGAPALGEKGRVPTGVASLRPGSHATGKNPSK